MTDTELARIVVTSARRVVGVLATLTFGAVFGWAFVTEGHALLLPLSAGAFILAILMWRATADAVVLTPDGVFNNRGEVIARLDQIDTLVSGHFTLRPSNGFSLRLRTPVAARWRPGLWWSLGTRVGVGGLASGRQTKVFAETLIELLEQ